MICKSFICTINYLLRLVLRDFFPWIFEFLKAVYDVFFITMASYWNGCLNNIFRLYHILRIFNCTSCNFWINGHKNSSWVINKIIKIIAVKSFWDFKFADLSRSEFVVPFQIAWRTSKQGGKLINNSTPSQCTQNMCWTTGWGNGVLDIFLNLCGH